jgi:hypothetical protein
MRRRQREEPLRVVVVITSVVETAMEWYDFGWYDLHPAPKSFHPTCTQVVPSKVVPFHDSLRARRTAQACCLSYRFPGQCGVLFTNIGDTYGLKKAIVLRAVFMGLSPMGIRCLPTYYDIGLLATVLLAVMRFLQGL